MHDDQTTLVKDRQSQHFEQITIDFTNYNVATEEERAVQAYSNAQANRIIQGIYTNCTFKKKNQTAKS